MDNKLEEVLGLMEQMRRIDKLYQRDFRYTTGPDVEELLEARLYCNRKQLVEQLTELVGYEEPSEPHPF